MIKFLMRTVLATCAAFFATGVLAQDGTVLVVQGNVALYRNSVPVMIKAGDPVYSGDAFSTGADGIVRWKMSDNSYYAVGPNTQMRVEKYHMPAATETPSTGVVLLRLFKGIMRTATGLIGHRNPTGWALKTPTATLGIRGSVNTTMVDDAGNTYSQFEEGSGTMTGANGETKNMGTGEAFQTNTDGSAGQSQDAASKINEAKQNAGSEFNTALNTGDTGTTTTQQKEQTQQQEQSTQDQQQTSPRIESDSTQ